MICIGLAVYGEFGVAVETNPFALLCMVFEGIDEYGGSLRQG
jgi:hypothetical protein